MFKVGKGKKRKTGRGIGAHERTKFTCRGDARKGNICSPVARCREERQYMTGLFAGRKPGWAGKR